ncbi:hypothetical protein [Haloarcula marina]|uniref:hypothetical protein n=1 Tax=Haloarcula marina TaxID=2961574 RepID=UPI0020B6AD8A|nr:hypothetical protein [Halomicroarcula marina]
MRWAESEGWDMSDSLSPFDDRMRWPALGAVVIGFGLAFLAVYVQRTAGGTAPPWAFALPFGAIAAAFLYAVMYRNMSKRLG